MIGVQAGTIYETQMRKLRRSYRSYGTLDALTEAVIAGEVDLMLAAMPPGAEAFLTGEAGLVQKGSESIPDLGTAMVICKGNEELKQRIDAALQAMLRDGTLDEISRDWFQ
jgi:ABC-type amino acid transport substrate-binding protein